MFLYCRDSKLTRLLQQSLGGNSYTAAICNISAARVHAEETKSTLRFASFTSLIKNSVKKNESKANVQLLKQYRQEIEKLKQQLGGDLEDQVGRARSVREGKGRAAGCHVCSFRFKQLQC